MSLTNSTRGNSIVQDSKDQQAVRISQDSPRRVPELSYKWLKESLMAKWLEQASQWHEMYCHNLEVMSLNSSRVELGMRSTSALSRNWTKNKDVQITLTLSQDQSGINWELSGKYHRIMNPKTPSRICRRITFEHYFFCIIHAMPLHYAGTE